MVGVAVIADGEPVVAEQPGDGAFDDPPVAAEFGGRLDAFAGDAWGDAAVAEPGAEVVCVLGRVS